MSDHRKRLPSFLDQPSEHLMSQRTLRDRARWATAVHYTGGRRPAPKHTRSERFMLALAVFVIFAMNRGWL